ncbi:hypothetical protein ACOSQ4_014965 [Xanthoceras sorbifolium]
MICSLKYKIYNREPDINHKLIIKFTCHNIGMLLVNTPMVYLNNVVDGCVARIAAKLEMMEPCSSIKDMIAYNMITDADEKGLITPGKTVFVECTSGNTGIGMACIAAARGYKLILVMPASLSIERRIILCAYGAQLILTDPNTGIEEEFRVVDELLKKIPDSLIPINSKTLPTQRYFRKDSLRNHWTGNLGSHRRERTGGTVTGVGKFFKEKHPEIKVCGMEPAERAILNGGNPGHHKIQGLGVGFIPAVLEVSILDEVVIVPSDEAIATAKLLAAKEGLLVGISSGAAAAAAFNIAKRAANAGKLVIVIFPSSGERYLSSEISTYVWWLYRSPYRVEDPSKPWPILLWLQGGPDNPVGTGYNYVEDANDEKFFVKTDVEAATDLTALLEEILTEIINFRRAFAHRGRVRWWEICSHSRIISSKSN